MTQIICRVSACAFWEQGVCSAEEIEYELDEGCLTFQDMGDLDLEEEEEEDFEWNGEPGSSLYADDDDDDDDDWDDDDWDDDDDFDL